jgi:selT/selW/selH-like putative selenoprotein
MTMKRMLETSFPGIHVVLLNYPPPFPKRVLTKAVPILQVGAIATIMAGDQIFSRLGIVPPPWYYSLRANRFGTMATIWLFGNFAQSFLQSSGAFEVYCNGDLVFLLFFFLLGADMWLALLQLASYIRTLGVSSFLAAICSVNGLFILPLE